MHAAEAISARGLIDACAGAFIRATTTKTKADVRQPHAAQLAYWNCGRILTRRDRTRPGPSPDVRGGIESSTSPPSSLPRTLALGPSFSKERKYFPVLRRTKYQARCNLGS